MDTLAPLNRAVELVLRYAPAHLNAFDKARRIPTRFHAALLASLAEDGYLNAFEALLDIFAELPRSEDTASIRSVHLYLPLYVASRWVSALGALSHVTSLHLNASLLASSAAISSALRALPALQCLEVHGVGKTAARAIAHCTNVTSLRLSHCLTEDAASGDERSNWSAGCPSCKRVAVRSCRNAPLIHILAPLKHLAHLSLAHSLPDDSAVKDLATALPAMPALTHLELRSAQVRNASRALYAPLAASLALRQLSLQSCYLHDAAPGESRVCLTGLQCLSLQGSQLDDNGTLLAAATCVTALSIEGSSIMPGNSVPLHEALGRFTALRDLNASDVRASNAPPRATPFVSGLASLPHLSHLQLSAKHAGRDFVATLAAALPQFTALSELRICGPHTPGRSLVALLAAANRHSVLSALRMDRAQCAIVDREGIPFVWVAPSFVEGVLLQDLLPLWRTLRRTLHVDLPPAAKEHIDLILAR